VFGAVFAATMMLVTGVFQVVNGLGAIVRGAFYQVSPHYLFDLRPVAYGWIHLVLGVLMVACGFALYRVRTWAVVAGIVLATLTMIDQFLFLPYFPFWSVLTIAAAGFVVWSLVVVLQGNGDRRRVPGPPPTGLPPVPPAGTTPGRLTV
jgi:hypothetical protein